MFRGIGVSFVAASVVVLAGCEHIGGSFETRTSLDVGYQYLSFKGVSYEHDTHPDDTSFLSGSAGETEIDEGQALKAAARLKVLADVFGVLVADAQSLKVPMELAVRAD